MRAAVLTISDRSARGEREDLSGPQISRALEGKGWSVERLDVIADDQVGVEAWLIDVCDGGVVDLILTTGGTGFSPRDQAPEATTAVIDRPAPGIPEAMRAASARKTPHAMLSRGVAGIRGQTLIVNLPGSPRAAFENLQVILPVLEHAIALLVEKPEAEAGHRPQDKPRHV